MRIERLDLTRFGIFTDRSLDLTARGLHVVVGANEAGKTTAMQAIRQLLYGIPERSDYGFVHPGPSMAIGARLMGDDGEHLEIVRLKKRKDPLRDASDRPIEANELARFLHNTPEQVFVNLFTIGHEEISEGGRELLDLDGEVGTAIFGVRSGNLPLGSVLTALDSRTEELFTSRGRNPSINTAVREYVRARSEVADLSHRPTEVVELDRRIETLSRRIEEVNDRRRGVKNRLALLNQIRDTRSRLARRSENLGRLADLEAQGPLVDAGVSERFTAAVERRSAARIDEKNVLSAIGTQNEKLEGLVVDTALLEQRGTIQRLVRELGAYTESSSDLPTLRANADGEERSLTSLRAQLPERMSLDDDGLPAIPLEQRLRTTDLAARWAALDAASTRAEEEVTKAGARLAENISRLDDLDDPGDVAFLRELSDGVRELGPLEKSLDAKSSERRRVATDTSAKVSALGLAGTPMEEITALPVASAEVIRATGEELAELVRQIDATDETISGLSDELEADTATLASLMSTDDPPSPEDLTVAREHRDRGWRLIRDVWLDGAPVDSDDVNTWTAGASLESVYERAVVDADGLADRMRLSADAVAQRAQLEQRIATTRESIRTAEADLDELRTRHGDALERWTARWTAVGVTAEDPASMEKWRSDFDEVCRSLDQLAVLDEEIAALTSAIDRHRGDLLRSLRASGDEPDEGLSLVALLARAARLVADSTELASQRKALEEARRTAASDLTKREEDLKTARRELDDWRSEWAEAVGTIGLVGEDTPSTATAVLELVDAVETHAKELAGYRERISGIEERHERFTGSLAALLEGLPDHRDLAALSPEVAVQRLSAMLETHSERAAKMETIAGQVAEYQAQLEDTERELSDTRAVIDGLIATAGVDDEEALGRAVQRSIEHAELTSVVQGIEDDLRESTGKTIDEIDHDAEAFDDTDIDTELELVGEQDRDLDDEFGRLKQEMGELTTKRAAVDSSDHAARRDADAEQILSAMIDDVDEYVRVVFARRLLDEQLNAVREEDQGPLMTRTGELFNTLTSNRYKGVDIDLDDRGEQVITARTTDDRLLGVDALSTGTRDQLYLALRFSALEQYIGRNGSLPIVLDDLLVHFDDERTRAGLRVLDTLADSAQVLLFTHHRHVAEHAAEVIDADRLTVHELTR